MQVSRLQQVYTLKYFSQAPIVQCEKDEFNVNENKFTVHEDCMNSCLEINRELYKISKHSRFFFSQQKTYFVFFVAGIISLQQN